MKTTRYFAEQVALRRPYISQAMCEAVLAAPLVTLTQPDGRFRLWGYVTDDRDGSRRALRLIVLEDGETIHNAFFDRDFEPPP